MEGVLKTIPAHFDGEKIQLDTDVKLEPNARLLVTILNGGDDHSRLMGAMMLASEEALLRVWDNDEDAVYDAL